MKTIDVCALQRTAVGGKTGAVTTVYAMGFRNFGEYGKVCLDTADWSIDYPNIYKVYATIRIHHPVTIWGSYDEIMQDIRRIAMQELFDSGMVVYNDHYTPVWVIEEAESRV